MEPVWDLAIVGAGPAGASAALSALYERPAARVLLIDRSDFPRDKACGDGIAPHALDVLTSVGVHGIEQGYPGVDRLQIGFSDGPMVDGVMPRPAFVVPREVFDTRLVRAAVERGAQLRHHRVRTLTDAAGDVPLVLDGRIRARVVIAADGASSVIRSQVQPPLVREPGLPTGLAFLERIRRGAAPSRRASTAVAIRGYAPVRASDAGRQVIRFSAPAPRRTTWPAYAWSFPLGDGRANVGYGELLRGREHPTRQYLLDRLEDLLPGAGSSAHAWRAHLLPLSTGRRRQPDGRTLFAGDAMNLINPVTGEGIFYAVASGVLAGRAALGPGDPGSTYRSLMRRTLGVHLRHTDAAALLARSPSIVAAAVRAADRNPATFDDLVELGLGAGRLTLPTLHRIAAALLR
ncbi:MAG: FAD-dependent monooxygenase [Actinomycetota bacterium]|nr:FAD-dependent monooxygenase [Actinomycetota bacterium]